MSGSNIVQVKPLRVAFPLYAANPAFENTAVTEDAVAWDCGIDADVYHFNKQWDKLAAKIILTLRIKSNSAKIAELTTRTTYLVTPGLTIPQKHHILRLLSLQTFAQAQGAWKVKNLNLHIANLVPQGLETITDDSPILAQTVKLKWLI